MFGPTEVHATRGKEEDQLLFGVSGVIELKQSLIDRTTQDKSQQVGIEYLEQQVHLLVRQMKDIPNL
jgi:hypothetical protein